MFRSPLSLALAVLLALEPSHALISAQQFSDQSLCDKGTAFNSTNPAYPYSWNNNAWGDDGSGSSCTNITDNGARWSVTYKWTGNPTLVKGFPYMKAYPSNLPVQLSSITHLKFKGQWKTSVVSSGDDSNAALESVALHSNVALDMFLSDNATNSTGLNAPIEIMIWPWYIPSVKPLGSTESTPNIDSVNISGTNYSLYHGYNDGGQHVFSWLADQNLTSVDVDYAPLLRYIWEKGLLSPDLYVGQLEFGTEVLHAGDTMLFELWDYNMQLIRQGDKSDYPTSTASSSTSVDDNANATATMTGNATITTMTRASLPVSVLATPTTAAATSTNAAGLAGQRTPVDIGGMLALAVAGLGWMV